MAKLLAEAFPLGHWKNFQEMEENLTLDELYLLLEVNNEGEYNRRKFAAALQNIDLEEGDKDEDNLTPFERVQQQANEMLGKKTEEFESADPFGLDGDDDD